MVLETDADNGGSGSGATEGGCGEEDEGADPSGLGGGRSFSFSLAVRDAGGGSAETNASWCCDGGGTLCDETSG
jgi:hypothetical protein